MTIYGIRNKSFNIWECDWWGRIYTFEIKELAEAQLELLEFQRSDLRDAEVLPIYHTTDQSTGPR